MRRSAWIAFAAGGLLLAVIAWVWLGSSSPGQSQPTAVTHARTAPGHPRSTPAGLSGDPDNSPRPAEHGDTAGPLPPSAEKVVQTARTLAVAGTPRATPTETPPAHGTENAPPPDSTPSPPPAPAPGGGTLDKESIRAAVRGVTPAIKHCYESGLKLKEGSAGVVKVSFTLVASDGGGFMRDAEILDSELGNPLVDACVLESLSTASFPMPPGDGEVRVTYPFKFSL